MKSTRETQGSLKGLLISVLLHGIFFASLMALDISRPAPDSTGSETVQAVDQAAAKPEAKVSGKSKS